MDVEASLSFSSISPPVYDGKNYKVWTVHMEGYIEVVDISDAVEKDYEISILQAIHYHSANQITQGEEDQEIW